MRILITGAGRGLGQALTQIGAERGHHILAGVRNGQQMEESGDSSPLITGLKLDVTDEDSVVMTADIVKEQYGSIDVVINNAGILLERDKTIEEIDIAQVQRTFDINVFGPMRVVKHFLPLLLNSDKSAIINISSDAGSITNAYGGDYAYATSKTALNMFSHQLSKYVRAHGMKVYAIHPGWIKTDMGGQNAPGSPIDTANNIFDLIEGKITIESNCVFINHDGNPMLL